MSSQEGNGRRGSGERVGSGWAAGHREWPRKPVQNGRRDARVCVAHVKESGGDQGCDILQHS